MISRFRIQLLIGSNAVRHCFFYCDICFVFSLEWLLRCNEVNRSDAECFNPAFCSNSFRFAFVHLHLFYFFRRNLSVSTHFLLKDDLNTKTNTDNLK